MPTYSFVYNQNQAVDQSFEGMCQVNALGKDLFGTYKILGVGDNTITDFAGSMNFVMANWSNVGIADVPGVHFYWYFTAIGAFSVPPQPPALTSTPVKIVVKNR